MKLYVGLDLSQRKTAICVVDDKGKMVTEGSALTLPSDISEWLRSHNIDFPSIEAVCLEAGAVSSFVYKGLEANGLPVVCVDAYQAHQFLKTQRNKTDKNDARGLAQFIRLGGDYIRVVAVKDTITQEQRMLLTLRQRYVMQKVSIENAISGILKPLGIIVPRGWHSPGSFSTAFFETLAKNENVGPCLRTALIDAIDNYSSVNDTLDRLNHQIKKVATEHPVCRRLMTVPGVGPIISLSFVTAIDNPRRFTRSSDVGAYLGLTPKKYQSGDMDHNIGISKAGNTMTRTHLVQAATILLYSSKKHSTLRAWGTGLAKRRGHHIARVAVARKLSKILYRMWVDETDFMYSREALQEAEAA
jgi:transposase